MSEVNKMNKLLNGHELDYRRPGRDSAIYDFRPKPVPKGYKDMWEYSESFGGGA